MSIAYTDPLAHLRLFEDAFNRLLSEPPTGRPWSPQVDIYETDNEVVLKADLPDMDLNDIDLRVENQTLTLKGERKFHQEEATKGFHRIERNYGSFTRSFSVPHTVDTDKVGAEYRNGVLTIALPKKETAKPRQVKVEVKG